MIYQRRISASLKEQVTEQAEYISIILENSMDAKIFTNKDNLIQVWNKGAEKIFEYKADEVIGKGFQMIIPSEIDAESELKQIDKIFEKQGYIANYIASRITKSGRRITVNISRTMITSSKGETRGILSSYVTKPKSSNWNKEYIIPKN